MDPWTRRGFLRGGLALAGLGLLSACGTPSLPWRPAKPARLGYLILTTAAANAALDAAFREGLRALGYVEGRNITLEARYADNVAERLPALAAELVRLPVDVIVTAATQPAIAAQRATTSIPIVMATGGDPVANGLVASLAHPGGNITGLSTIEGPLYGKRLDLLKETVPNLARLAVLWNPANPDSVRNFGAAEQAARELGLQLRPVPAREPGDFPTAFAALAREPSDALLVIQTPLSNSHFEQVASFALSRRLPSISGQTAFTDVGGLMIYGPNFGDLYRRAAGYVDRILKGAEAADLPVEQATKFDFVINLKTAQALGLTIPESVLQQATELIQ